MNVAEIKFPDIQVGDTIKAVRIENGAKREYSGIVASADGGCLETSEGGEIWAKWWGQTGEWMFLLIDRPKPKLPTAEGSLILVRFEGYTEPMILRKGYWEPLYGTHRYTEEWVSIREWKPAVVKPEVKS